MFLLIIFAFIAGIVTILSPCILPILPIVLSGSLGGGKKRPLGVITGFILSFTFFTLFLTTIVKVTGISADLLRNFSVIVVLLFGISLLSSKTKVYIEKLFSKLAGISPKQTPRSGFLGGILIGLSLGLVWTPCVGPILAAIISLAISGSVTGSALFITLSYSMGTAIPMLLITYGGRELLSKNPWVLTNSAKIQKAFGVLMVVTAVGIFFNIDRKFQSLILDKLPGYGVGLTKFEDNRAVQQELEKLKKKDDLEVDKENIGKPMSDLFNQESGFAPELIAGGQWFNSKPLKIADQRGKVVLIDFWTYTCINCIRTLPYLKTWHQKYKDKGLVIIGVHTPEFEFEKNPDNVKKAIKDFGLEYPIMQDNEYATWNAYANRYWPAKYFIDKNGKIRFTHFGEGAYDESEARIQKLLSETGSEVGDVPIDNPAYQIVARTPELYLGARRIEYLASPERILIDKPQNYTAPSNLQKHNFAYIGTWTVGDEYAMPSANSSLVLNFEAKEVFLVMRSKDVVGRFHIILDDKELDTVAGLDVKENIVTVDTDRLYRLIKLSQPGVHTLKLEFLDNKLELYAFTFG